MTAAATKAPLVYGQFAKAFAAVGAIGKGQKNQHHGYSFRGIDDVLNHLHGVLADHELFYLPRLVAESYEEWQTSKGGRLQVARLTYEFVFYATDGSTLVAGPVVGQSADTDDKAPMQALSQAAKVALLHAFCIKTEDLVDADTQSAVSEQGGRVAAPEPQPADAGKLQHIRELHASLPEGATTKTADDLVAYAKDDDAKADVTIARLRAELDAAQKVDAGEEPF